ncbi:hypothetical protein [Sphingomonas sp. Leaf412]|uniref:hypothetical protein n=1 Tax=Sphingomonas sp. Leaf412 TaxID=1736370 RepID=UPI000A984D72|nr:hypothetical protein [Sphingomonas sp. Leaf412]
MDLNHLFHRHQVSLNAVENAATPEARLSHEGLLAGYAAGIAALQDATGARSPFGRPSL